MTISVSGSQITFNDASTQNTAATGFGFKNRIINGAMMIDQRNAGAAISVTATGYPVDRFYVAANSNGVISAQRSSVAPQGFVNSTSLTVTTARTSIAAGDVYGYRQIIEGFNTADFNWGTVNAQAVTLSFWVRSSITGTYTTSIFNAAFNRSYISTYTINNANTWEYKTITIAGDTTGTWATDNTGSLNVYWDLGSGSNYNGTAGSWAGVGAVRTSGSTNWISTNGATFYITGVQLEKGSTATSFDYRPYGTELQLCQRYAYKLDSLSSAYTTYGITYADTTSVSYAVVPLPVTMRSTISLTTTGTAANYAVAYAAVVTACNAVPALNTYNQNGVNLQVTVAGTPLTAGRAGVLISNNNTASYLLFTSEL